VDGSWKKHPIPDKSDWNERRAQGYTFVYDGEYRYTWDAGVYQGLKFSCPGGWRGRAVVHSFYGLLEAKSMSPISYTSFNGDKIIYADSVRQAFGNWLILPYSEQFEPFCSGRFAEQAITEENIQAMRVAYATYTSTIDAEDFIRFCLDLKKVPS